jgi:hypothetical protein
MKVAKIPLNEAKEAVIRDVPAGRVVLNLGLNNRIESLLEARVGGGLQ